MGVCYLLIVNKGYGGYVGIPSKWYTGSQALADLHPMIIVGIGAILIRVDLNEWHYRRNMLLR